MISSPCVLPAASGPEPGCLPLPPVRVIALLLFLVVFLGVRVVLNRKSRTEESPSLPEPQTRAVTSRCSQHA